MLACLLSDVLWGKKADLYFLAIDVVLLDQLLILSGRRKPHEVKNSQLHLVYNILVFVMQKRAEAKEKYK